MTVLLVLLFICVFLAIDYLKTDYRKKVLGPNRSRAPDIYFHPNMAPTMCDGGVRITQMKEKGPNTWLKLHQIVRPKT